MPFLIHKMYVKEWKKVRDRSGLLYIIAKLVRQAVATSWKATMNFNFSC